MYCVKTNCLHATKIDNHHNKNDANVRTSYLENGGECVTTLFTFFALNDLYNNELVLY